MQAAVITAPGKVEVTTLEDPTPASGEVVVEVASVGICGRDLHLLHGVLGLTLPVVPGHEFAGTVVAVANDVTGLAVGDRVAVDPNNACHMCRECGRGRTNLCSNHAARGVTMAGGAADFVAAPAGRCVTLPASLVEPLSCAVRAFDVVATQLGHRVLVYGAGTMDRRNAALALRAGAATVDVINPNKARLASATTAGADRTTISADQLDDGAGWDIVIDPALIISDPMPLSACPEAIAAFERREGRMIHVLPNQAAETLTKEPS